MRVRFMSKIRINSLKRVLPITYAVLLSLQNILNLNPVMEINMCWNVLQQIGIKQVVREVSKVIANEQ